MRARRFLPLALTAVLLTGGFVARQRPEPASGETFPVGLSLQRRCALAKAMVRVPNPWPVVCVANQWPNDPNWTVGDDLDRMFSRSGQILYHWDEGPDSKMWRPYRIEVYAGTDEHPMSLDFVAEMIGHEIGHGYSYLAFSFGDPSDDWVWSHEPYMDHWGRCVSTRWAPC